MLYTICDECPCFNHDELACNLDYNIIYNETNLGWFSMSGNCQLIKIITKDEEFLPEQKELELIYRPPKELSEIQKYVISECNKKIKEHLDDSNSIFKKLLFSDGISERGNIDTIKINMDNVASVARLNPPDKTIK